MKISKVITYLQNRLYMNNLNGVNDYGTKFFLQYLFEPEKDTFPGLNINFDDFIGNIKEIFSEYKKKIKTDPLLLIKTLKWKSSK